MERGLHQTETIANQQRSLFFSLYWSIHILPWPVEKPFVINAYDISLVSWLHDSCFLQQEN